MIKAIQTQFEANFVAHKQCNGLCLLHLDETARKAIEDSESEYNIPATDLLRFGERGLIDSIDKLI